jgi:hypothetical protein
MPRSGAFLPPATGPRGNQPGGMRTRWAFTVTGGKISRFETGQA